MEQSKVLKVVEVFKSFQGEGLDIGLPSIFIRFAGCNLACTFCDTPYASRLAETEYKDYTVNALIDEITRVAEPQEVLGICLTGGEPFLQDPELLDSLLFTLKGKGYYIDIQTNGTMLLNLENFKYVDRFSVSPKLSSSGNANSIKPDILQKYITDYGHKTFFKFVISNQEDFAEMEVIVSKLFKQQKKVVPVVIQPNIDLTTAESVASQIVAFKKILEIAKDNAYFVKKYGIRIIPQFHKFIYNNQKQV